MLEEAGKDASKFDHLVPTIVKPISRNNYIADTTTVSCATTSRTAAIHTAITATTTTTIYTAHWLYTEMFYLSTGSYTSRY